MIKNDGYLVNWQFLWLIYLKEPKRTTFSLFCFYSLLDAWLPAFLPSAVADVSFLNIYHQRDDDGLRWSVFYCIFCPRSPQLASTQLNTKKTKYQKLALSLFYCNGTICSFTFHPFFHSLFYFTSNFPPPFLLAASAYKFKAWIERFLEAGHFSIKVHVKYNREK